MIAGVFNGGMYELFTNAFAFERFISLRTGRVLPSPFVKRFIHQLEDDQLDRDEALLVCEENGSPAAKIFAAAARKWGYQFRYPELGGALRDLLDGRETAVRK